MKIKITWTIQGMDFEAIANTISEAYEFIKAIVKAKKDNFPNSDETLSECMVVLTGILCGGRDSSYTNLVFRIERIQ